ncbi:hypothetical protein ACIGMX_16430 [Streptomyces aquilus]|uniref:hypothetical protein n=1 Tax=Streptomyces aquilus TaxID=2548456 RepID=UPI0037CDCF4E
MPLPVGVETVTVSSGEPLTLPDGTWFQGRLLFTGPDLVTIGEDDVVLGGTAEAKLVDGEFSVKLCATDATGMSPTGWTYKVTSVFTNAPNWTRYIALPKAVATVKLADVVVPDPEAGTFTVLKDPSYIGAVAVSGTPTAGQVPTATSATAATWQTPAGGGGGGAAITTAKARIVDDDLSGLPAAAQWAVVQTSAGTRLQCSIAASVGDRIRVCPNFLYLGSHYLDWVLLTAGGAIAEYATTETSTAPAEGNPAMYPSTTLSKGPAPEMFTVGSGHISGGNVTVALAHQGLGTGPSNRVYAHTTYPFRMRLENIGPEPS